MLVNKALFMHEEIDEVKMVFYIVEECGMPCFSLAVTEWQMTIRTAEVRPYCFFFVVFFCFGRGTSVARRDQGGGLTLPESCPGFCRSRYDAQKPEIGDEDSASLKTYPDVCMIEIMINHEEIIIFLI